MAIFVEAKDPRDGGSVMVVCVSAEQALAAMAELRLEGLADISAKDERGNPILEDELSRRAS
jgi:hypothetical protein